MGVVSGSGDGAACLEATSVEAVATGGEPVAAGSDVAATGLAGLSAGDMAPCNEPLTLDRKSGDDQNRAPMMAAARTAAPEARAWRLFTRSHMDPILLGSIVDEVVTTCTSHVAQNKAMVSPGISGRTRQQSLLDPRETAGHKPVMTEIKNICVYCGSSAGVEPALMEAASHLGRAMAEAGIGLVYGGGNNGLMGATARSVLDAGGRVTGIIPDFLQRRENMLDGAQEMITVEDMHTRKRLMFERSDAFVALPGGVGTLEELVEQMTWVQLERHTKPVLIANIEGFWKPLLSLFTHMRDFGFVKPEMEINYLVAEKAEDILPMILASHERMMASGRAKLDVNPKL